jgi:hypothetical protein
MSQHAFPAPSVIYGHRFGFARQAPASRRSPAADARKRLQPLANPEKYFLKF